MSGVTEPLGRRNHHVKRLRKLARDPSARRTEGVVVVEGPRPIAVALDAGVVDTVFVEVDAHVSLVSRCRDAGAEVLPVAGGVLASTLTTVSPQPVAALVARPAHDVTEIAHGAMSTGRPIVVLAGIGDPGNVGTIVRSSAAAGAAGIMVAEGSADPFGPKAVRASAGAAFSIPVVSVELAPALVALRAARLPIHGAAPHGGTDPTVAPLDSAFGLVLGAEVQGLPAEIDVDGFLTLVHDGPAESLNVAMAGTALLFEAARQRRAGSR